MTVGRSLTLSGPRFPSVQWEDRSHPLPGEPLSSIQFNGDWMCPLGCSSDHATHLSAPSLTLWPGYAQAAAPYSAQTTSSKVQQLSWQSSYPGSWGQNLHGSQRGSPSRADWSGHRKEPNVTPEPSAQARAVSWASRVEGRKSKRTKGGGQLMHKSRDGPTSGIWALPLGFEHLGLSVLGIGGLTSDPSLQ